MSRPLWVLALFIGTATLQATPLTFDFNLTGTDSAGDAVSASVVFTVVDAHHFTISIVDTTSMQALEQILQGIEFNVDGSGVVLESSDGSFVMVNGNGTVTELSSGATGWGLEGSGSTWDLCAQCGSSGDGMVGSGPYTSALAGAYLDNTATFDFYSNSALPMDGTDPFWNVSLTGFTNSGPTGTGAGANGQSNGGGPGSSGPGRGDPGSGDPGSGDPGDPSGGGPDSTQTTTTLSSDLNNGTPSSITTNAGILLPEPAGLITAAAALMALAAAKRLRG